MRYNPEASLNLQAPEDLENKADGSTLDVHSIFYTIQGEGPYAGWPAIFIRLAGCNLQCPQCDTDYTSMRGRRPVIDIVAQACAVMGQTRIKTVHMDPSIQRAPLAVVTGGEPFRQNLEWLLDGLIMAGLYVQVESNGTLRPSHCEVGWTHDPQDQSAAHLVVSPKTGAVHKSAWDYAMAVKYVGDHTNISDVDGLPVRALDHPNSGLLARPPKSWRRPIYLQPTDFADVVVKDHSDRQTAIHLLNAAAQDAVVKSCMKFGHILCLQTHKIIGVP